MRIAFFADSYKPYLSGVTNSAEILVNELRQLGHQVFILAPRYPKHIDTDPEIIRFPSFAGGYPKFRLAIPVVRKIPEVDLIHSHSPFQAGLLARFVARRRKVPFVYSFHTLFTRYVHYARFVPKALAKMGIIAYLQAFCRGADQIIVPSEMARRVLRAWHISRPVAVIPSGVELQQYPKNFEITRNKLRAKYGIGEKETVLLYVGRLSKEKNISFLLKAFSRLETRDARLVLVGGGPLKAGLLRHKGIVLTGEVPYPEILSYYLLGDIFIFSSTTETQGMVLAEAKAAGLPVVALFAGGLVGTVRSGIDGYLVPRDLSVFVEHVRRLATDPILREQMSRAAREDAVERFSSFVVAKKIESVYNSLMKNKLALCSVFCFLLSLLSPSFSSPQVLPSPSLNGPTGLVRIPSADCIPYKNFNLGADYGASATSSTAEATVYYKMNLGTFHGVEFGVVGNTDPKTSQPREGVFINMKLSLSTGEEPYPLLLALGLENLFSYTKTDVYMVATKYFKQGPKATFGFMADFPNNKFRPLGIAGVEVPMGDTVFLLTDLMAGETLFQANAGARFYFTPIFSLNLYGLNVLDSGQVKDPRTIFAGFSWANPF